MPTGLLRAKHFVWAALAWSLGLFAILRAPLIEERVLLPVTAMQKAAADYFAGTAPVRVAVTLECSGADVLALCLAAILACPVPWRARVGGAVGAVAFVLALNTVRIATLGRAAASPALFQALHLRVWPAVLAVATAGYVFVWMRHAAAPRRPSDERGSGDATLSPLLRRYVPRAALLLVAFALAGPWIAASETLSAAGGVTAEAAAGVLSAAGLFATASGNVLTTSRGAFIVTPECLATALVPLSVAAIFTLRLTWRWRILALAAIPPVFGTLAVIRLLLLALPSALAASPLFVVHGFHQLVLAVVCVVLLALVQEPPACRNWPRVARRAGGALAAAAVVAVVAGAALGSAVLALAGAVASVMPHILRSLSPPGDSQGALALLPAYQAGLLLALGMTFVAPWRRVISAFAVLLATQVVLLILLGELAASAGVGAHALLVRSWAVGVPIVLALAMLRPERAPAPALTAAPPANGPS